VERLAAWQQLLDRLRRAPGVESASVSSWGLFEGRGRNKEVRIPGRAIDAYMPWYLSISPGFLTTMRIPLLAGRDFDWRDAEVERPSAVIVNESFAARYFPGRSPLGQRFFRVDGGSTLVPQEIIGVAADAKYTGLREPAPPTVYDPYRPDDGSVVQVRTRLDTGALAAIGRDMLRGRPGLQLNDVTLQSTLVGNSLARDRVLAALSAFFSLVAIALVIVGLYGLLSYSLVQRTREIGIRLALGARPAGVARTVLSDVARMTIVGLAVGVAAALYAGDWLAPLLFELTPSDPWNISAPLACLLLAGAAAALVPVMRAARVDPTVALRSE
jgi:predicted permease